MGRTINTAVKKKDQVSHGWLGLYSQGFTKLYFKSLPVSKHGSEAGSCMFWKMCLNADSTKSAVSSPRVTYARQTTSDGGWKVRRRQWQQAAACLAPCETTAHALIFHARPFQLARPLSRFIYVSGLRHLSVYWRGFKISYGSER